MNFMPKINSILLTCERFLLTQRKESTYIKRGDDLIVKISDGYIRGKYNETENGRRFKSFTGIPFAKPPLGELRFRDAIPVDKWHGIKDATKQDFEFLQYNSLISKLLGNETLSINVCIPERTIDNVKPMPVLVYLLGGIFKFGTTDYRESGPDYLFDVADVVYVTFKFRLGIYGSLCLDIPEVSGNNALKDQVLALKWIRTNISVFGGDPNNVTLLGMSSGAIQSHLHVVSPMSQGLFHKVILHSGCALNDRSINLNPKKYAFEIANTLGYHKRNEYEILKFLESVTSNDLVMAAHELNNTRKNAYHEMSVSFAPVVEKRFNNKTGFLNSQPLDVLMSGNFSKVPMLMSFTNYEGAICISFMRLMWADLLQSYKLFESIPYEIKDNMKSDIKRKLIEIYGDENREFNQKFDSIIKYLGDSIVTSGLITSARIHGQYNSSNVFLNSFEYKGGLNFFQNAFKLSSDGAIHGEQDGYVLRKNSNPKIFSEKDRQIRDTMIEMYLNFMKFGNPTPEVTPLLNVKWEPVTSAKLNCLRISNKLAMDDVENFMGNRAKLWEELTRLPKLDQT